MLYEEYRVSFSFGLPTDFTFFNEKIQFTTVFMFIYVYSYRNNLKENTLQTRLSLASEKKKGYFPRKNEIKN